jgi:predicted RNase H-like HicB family nuclease
MEISITIEVWQKGKWFVSKCPELDFVSQGETREDAKKNLLEVIQIQIEEMKELGTLNDFHIRQRSCNDHHKTFAYY